VIAVIFPHMGHAIGPAIAAVITTAYDPSQ
jgi:hypothetical protein